MRKVLTYQYTSRLSSYITGFIEEKRSVGYLYNDEAKIMRQFDEYWQENCDSVEITPTNIQNWTSKKETEISDSTNHRISVLRQFCRYMHSLNLPAYLPPLVPCNDHRPIVHILTYDEIRQVFEVIDQYYPEKPYAATVRMSKEYKVLFRLIITTGLRNSEAANIEIEHLNLENGTVVIYNGKNKKDRIVYISNDMCRLLERYISYLRGVCGNDIRWLFPGLDISNPVTTSTVTSRFRSCWLQTEASKTCTKNPTVHALRHTYVVYRMNLWEQEKQNMSVMMRYLSRQLGHVGPQETYYYYHLVAAAFGSIRERDTYSDAVLPEVRDR